MKLLKLQSWLGRRTEGKFNAKEKFSKLGRRRICPAVAFLLECKVLSLISFITFPVPSGICNTHLLACIC